jgi:hypothetical protein
LDIRYRSAQEVNGNPDLKRPYKFDLLALGIVSVVGLLHLPYPFGGDQAVFTLGASKISQGGLLYRDFWDVKQPGIFGFYLLAGRLFGFNEVGVHALELVYMIAFSVVLILCCRTYFRERWLVSLVPLFTVGVYYGLASFNHLTQLESLIGFPIFLSLYWASETGKHRGRSLFLSGLMGGVVLQFKFVLAPILFCFWLTAFLSSARRKKTTFAGELLHGILPILMGALIPALVVLLWFARMNDLGPLLYTTFKYPLLVARELPKLDRTGALLTGFQWFLGNFAPLVALGFVGGWLAFVRSADLMTINLGLWVVVGFGLILLQRYSWWEYHYFLLLVPLSILTVKAIEIVWDALRARRAVSRSPREQLAFAIFLTMLFSPVLDSWTMLGLRLARHKFALAPAERLRFQRSLNPAYESATTSVAFLSQQSSLPGDIFVFGSPVYYRMAGRNQAVAIVGSMPDLLLPEQWTELKEQLAKALPPYIYVADDQVEFQKTRAPGMVQFINNNYRFLHTDCAGTWYILAVRHD